MRKFDLGRTLATPDGSPAQLPPRLASTAGEHCKAVLWPAENEPWKRLP